MNDSSLMCFVFSILAAFRFQEAAVQRLPIVTCNEPVAATVAVDPHYRFRPYYVRLHRCQGSWKQFSPKTKKCVPTGLKEIKIQVLSLDRQKVETRSVFNHTSCGGECTTRADKCNLRVQKWNEETCTCDCLFNEAPPPDNVMKRKKGFRWNKHLCDYQCNLSPGRCSRRKEFNKQKCSCVCHSFYKSICDKKHEKINPNTCKCFKPHSSRGKWSPGSFKFVVIIILVVVVVVLVLFVLIFCYRRKRKQPVSESPQITPESSSVTSSNPESDDQSFKGQVNYEYETGV